MTHARVRSHSLLVAVLAGLLVLAAPGFATRAEAAAGREAITARMGAGAATLLNGQRLTGVPEIGVVARRAIRLVTWEVDPGTAAARTITRAQAPFGLSAAELAVAPGPHTLRAVIRGRTRWVRTAQAAFTVEAPVPARDVVSRAYFYRPPVGVDALTLARTQDRFVLTKLDEPLRDALRVAGATGPILQYVRFEAIQDPTGLGYTWHNQVAWKPGDWEMISRDHPDWFLLDAQGGRLEAETSPGQRFYMMDPANPGWRAFFVSRLREMRDVYGWQGVFLDNVEASLAKRERAGRLPARYPTDAAYSAAVGDFLSYLRAELFAREGVRVEANIIENRDDNGPVWHDYLRHLDGAMREGWALGWDVDGGYKDAWSWEQELRQAEATQAGGDHATLVAMGRAGDVQRRDFAVGSYLLVANGNASFRYTHWDAYDQLWDVPIPDLGEPLGPRYQQGGAWVRDFTRGQVRVDPAAHTTAFTAR